MSIGIIIIMVSGAMLLLEAGTFHDTSSSSSQYQHASGVSLHNMVLLVAS
jgi:hypothetical protein